MTKPRDPSECDDDVLLDQLRERIPRDDVRGRELLLETRQRLRRYRASIEQLNEGNVDELDGMIDEMGALLGIRPKQPNLRLVK
jgi:hypothetical protein